MGQAFGIIQQKATSQPNISSKHTIFTIRGTGDFKYWVRVYESAVTSILWFNMQLLSFGFVVLAGPN